MRTINFEGHEIEYDETCIKRYKWQKALASGDPARMVSAIESLFAGKDEEVSEIVGGTMDAMTALISAISEELGAKN